MNPDKTYKLAKVMIDAGRTAGLADLFGVLRLGGSLTNDQYMELVMLLPAEG